MRATCEFVAELASANSLGPSLIAAVVRLLAIPVVLMLMAMLVRDLMIGLTMLIPQVLMQLRMFVWGQSLIVSIPVSLIKLVVNISMLLIELLMLSTMTVRRMSKRRKRRSKSHRTDSRQNHFTHTASP